MYPHHTQSIQTVTEYFQRDPEVLAVLLGGSIAHGFESSISDVDIMILVSDDNYQRRFQKGEIHFYNKELCNYEGGYVDGKYLSLEFVKHVAAKGSEPARFAFAGSQILFSKVEGLRSRFTKQKSILLLKKPKELYAFTLSSKHGTGIVTKRWENEIGICSEQPSAN